MKWLRSYGWKLLGVILVAYGIYAGTSAKVGPGIVRVTPSAVEANRDFSITIEGYNTSFGFPGTEKLNGWIKTGNGIIACNNISVEDQNHLQMSFNGIDLKSDSALSRSATIILEDQYHGMFLGSEMLRLRFEPNTSGQLDSISDQGVQPQKLDQSFFSFPYRYVLYETIRNLNFHVPMWFVMMTLMLISFIYSILYLRRERREYDIWANAFAKSGLLFGLMGIATGMFWANFTWGTPWTNDPKLNGAAVAVLMYIAYQILRGSIDDEDKVARISAVYNIFAYPLFIVLIIVLPKVADFSLHPGAGDSVAFSQYDLNDNLRKVFYPASLGWILIGVWVSQLTGRVDQLMYKKEWK